MNKIKGIVIISLLLLLSGCSSWVNGNKILSDNNITDQQIKDKVIDGKTTLAEVDKLFGDKKEEQRDRTSKSFPHGTYLENSYRGHVNKWYGTYAHRKLVVAYDTHGVIINHDVYTNNFQEKNKFEEDPVNMRLNGFNSINRNDNDSKVLMMLGAPRLKTFSDNGNVLWVYANTEISRDASSYIPLYNYIGGTESGGSDRLYVEFKNNKVTNVYMVSVEISQGRGSANITDYSEKITSFTQKYK